MNTHTPGPWHSRTTDEGMLIVDLRPQCKGYADVIEIGDLEDTEGEDHANADLIAAAPDLLDALNALLPVVGHVNWIDTGGWKAKARAAITKATGEQVSSK